MKQIPFVNHSSLMCPRNYGEPCSVCEWLEKQKEKKK